MSKPTASGAAPDLRLRAFSRAGWIAVTVAACVVSAPLHGQDRQLSPSEVKAGFLLHLAEFVEWPDADFAGTEEPITFCITGAESLATALSRAAFGQAIKGRTVAVREDKPGDNLRSCQVLFVNASEQERVPHILSSLQGSSVLTVSDAQQFAEDGGVVQLALVADNRVSFFVNREAATVAKLQISAKLLTLSRIVSRAHVPGSN